MAKKSINIGSLEGSTSSSNSQPVSPQSINEAAITSEMHFDGSSTYYSLNEYEFKTIKNGTENYWKELFISCASIFVPVVINTISIGDNLKWDTSISNLMFFLNSLLTVITFVLSIIFGFFWNKSENKLKKVIKEVEAKPKFKV